MPASNPCPPLRHPPPRWSLASCPPTTGGAFAPQAITYFLRQDYPNCELLIVDDGTDPIDDLVPEDPRIRYLRLDHHHILGTKRNIACEAARGDILIHWDDDDWMGPGRVSYQVEHLLRDEADLCGTDQLLFFDPARACAWRYVYPTRYKLWNPWVAGCTLCYTRAFWQGNPFQERPVAEDVYFVWEARRKRIAVLPDATLYVSLIHPGNTSPREPKTALWKPFPMASMRCLLGEDLPFYEALAATVEDKT